MKRKFEIELAKKALEGGGVILYPTDTIWGLGCDATDENACQNLIALKKRANSKSFIILVDSFHMLEHYIPDFPEVCYELVDSAVKPLTIVYPGAIGLAPSVLAEDGSVGIRLTSDPICVALIRSMKKPLVSTSANVSGEKNPAEFDEISLQLKKDVNAVVPERLNERLTQASQIIKIGLNNSVEIIRR